MNPCVPLLFRDMVEVDSADMIVSEECCNGHDLGVSVE